MAEKFRNSALKVDGESLSDSAAAIFPPSALRLLQEEELGTGNDQQLGGRSGRTGWSFISSASSPLATLKVFIPYRLMQNFNEL